MAEEQRLAPLYDEEVEKLVPPSLAPAALLKHFGPGLILMMTGIGTSHLVTAPTAGGALCLRPAVDPAGLLYLQILRLPDGLPLHQRHRHEHDGRLRMRPR